MHKLLVFTVIYPKAEKYKADFINCLKEQTIQEFDLLIINDGCNHSDLEVYFSEFTTIVKDSGLSPSKNRELGIRYAYDNHYDKLIFCDIDDWFHPSRFEISLEKLKSTDIVVNNLNIVGEERNHLCDRYFSYSVDEKTVIDSDYLSTKNLLGLSNTAINVKEQALVEFPDELTIGDWYYFAICAERGLRITYCDEALTDYRQHNNNLIGIDDFSIYLFRKLVGLKAEHYEFLEKLYPSYHHLLIETRALSSLTDNEVKSLIEKNKKINPHPLWWENIKK